jgi:SAM-dependent methyltransferase
MNRGFKDVKYEKLSECPYCNSKNLKIIMKSKDFLNNLPGEFYLSKCGNCGLVFQNPRIREEYISIYYPDDAGYYTPQNLQSNSILSPNAYMGNILKHCLINHFGYIHLGESNAFWKILSIPFVRLLKINMIPYYVKYGHLLEIGCSHGHMLDKFKRLGWNVYGVEPHNDSAEYAKKVRGLNVANKRIEDVDFENDFGVDKFDVIIMNMVLEHLYNPFYTLKIITERLKPNGQLIFSIPYFEGIEFNIYREYCYGMHLPTHMFFLNKKIIEDYLTGLGYANIKFYFHFFDRDLVASSKYMYMENPSGFNLLLKQTLHNKLFRRFFIKPFVLLLSLLGKTSRITVYAEKS